jgi:hypothetical protein
MLTEEMVQAYKKLQKENCEKQEEDRTVAKMRV